MMTPLLPLGRLDHYTLIVPDAAACSRFHMEVLGFGWVRGLNGKFHDVSNKTSNE